MTDLIEVSKKHFLAVQDKRVDDIIDFYVDSPELLVFVEGNDARNFIDMPQEVRQQLVIEKITHFLGEEAAKPIEYIDKCWTEEEWSRGCYVGIMGPNTLTQFGHVLRKPFGLIHFAGTETAKKWNGYLDGAIESGYRAAEEVFEAFNIR
ncbi:MAG: FAD-dependent oxidoreductase [Pyrinomonadaceae bacterium]|nr:FAD-dependent oxidoreductase [Pyrinomonadaceae bacterium]